MYSDIVLAYVWNNCLQMLHRIAILTNVAKKSTCHGSLFSGVADLNILNDITQVLLFHKWYKMANVWKKKMVHQFW